MANLNNLLVDIPANLPDEVVETLLTTVSFRVERIVSHGHQSPAGFWYDQEDHEWVLLVAGAARLQFESEIVELKPGAFLNIPAHRQHRMQWTDLSQPTIWLAIFYTP
jgi:cupin 2 domain-containing protein